MCIRCGALTRLVALIGSTVWVMTLANCDSWTMHPLSTVPDDTPPQSSTVDPPEDMTPPQPADAGDDAGALTFHVSRGLCCDRLTYRFDADVSDTSIPDDAIFTWSFGDNRTKTGIRVEHTYSWSLDYVVTLTVQTPDNEVYEVALILLLSLGEEPQTVEMPDLTDDTDIQDDDPPDGDVYTVVADAGGDQQVEAGSVVTLVGTGSSGSGPEPVEFWWSQVSGPAVELDAPGSVTTTFVTPEPDGASSVLVFKLVATQGDVAEADWVTVEAVARPEETVPESAEQILEWLQALDPLPKVHYCYNSPYNMQVAQDPLVYEYARITRSLTIRAEWSSHGYIEPTVAMCQSVSSSDEYSPASIAISYSPWYTEWPKGLPPTYTGPEHDAEVELYRERLTRTRTLLDEANVALGADVQVPVILLECEVFQKRAPDEPDSEAWNAAIDEKYNVIYRVSKQVFPEARVEWFARGSADKHFTGQELGDGYSISMYGLPYEATMRSQFRVVYERVLEIGAEEVMPWVALASGYQRAEEPGSPSVWRIDWDYDRSISWRLGREINDPYYGDHPEAYAPWHAATTVTFFPSQFDRRVPFWPEHFIAYVRGAHGIEELP